jgi:Undecaprenyl-phosphate glucose phosphotransferase
MTLDVDRDGPAPSMTVPHAPKPTGALAHFSTETRLSPAAEAAAAALSSRAISRSIVAGTVRGTEALIVAVTGVAMLLAMVEPAHRFAWPYGLAIGGAALLYVMIAQLGGAYQIVATKRLLPQLGRVIANWVMVFAAVTIVIFLTRSGFEFSRAWFLTWFVAGLFSIIAFRVVVASRVRAWTKEGLLERRAVIVGGGAPAEKLIHAIDASPDHDIRICGIFDDRDDERSPPMVAGYAKLGTIDELVLFARKARIDLLIVTIPITAEKRVLMMMEKLWVLPVDIRLSMQTAGLRFRHRTYSFVGDVPFLDIADKPIADWDFVSKWMIDRILGSLILLMALPVMALVAVAIKLDSRGPVLFKQKRYGFNNEIIEVFKFRSLRTDLTDQTAAKQVTADDPRVTRVGRFIRRTSLDELPQLFNVVFQGSLSLVGPRPHAVEGRIMTDKLFEQVVDGYFARHRVKPGVTGWAQVNGLRGATDTQDKVQRRLEYDLYYIEHWSVLFDLYIIALTPVAVLKGDNAY